MTIVRCKHLVFFMKKMCALWYVSVEAISKIVFNIKVALDK